MLTYSQKTGMLTINGKHFARAYSGHGEGLNNHAMQSVAGIGPIPVGIYRMVAVKSDGPTGPYTIVLQPEPGTNTFGRSLFRYHGDNSKGDKSASHGCIVSLDGRPPRVAAWNLTDKRIEVVAE